MYEQRLFDKKMYDRIKEDFPRGGQHEKVFKMIMLFWFCVFIVFCVFCYRYYTTPTPAKFHVVEAYYSEDADGDPYYVDAIYIMNVEVEGRIAENSYDDFAKDVMNEYRDEFKDAYLLVINFYDSYQIDEETGKPDRKPREEGVYRLQDN